MKIAHIFFLEKSQFAYVREHVCSIGGFMIALIVGILLIAFTVFAGLPQGLGWHHEMLKVLKGGMPILLALIGLISIFVGIADIRDRKEEKKEEEKMKAEENSKA